MKGTVENPVVDYRAADATDNPRVQFECEECGNEVEITIAEGHSFKRIAAIPCDECKTIWEFQHTIQRAN